MEHLTLIREARMRSAENREQSQRSNEGGHDSEGEGNETTRHPARARKSVKPEIQKHP